MSDRGRSDGKGQPSSNYTGQHAEDEGLAGRLSRLARVLEHEDNVEDTLDAIVHAAVGTVPGAQHASISSIQRRREVRTRAATGELPSALDSAQYEAGQGPCLDTLYEQKTVRLSDLAGEPRWPEFTEWAGRLGVRSMLAVQLYVDGDDLGALNLLSEDSGAFDDESEHVALLFASHAAVAMAAAQQEEQLRQAVNTRDLIGQAKGILIERYKISGDRAFSLLVRLSQNENRKLHDVAEELVRTGELAGGAANSSHPSARPSGLLG